MGIKIRNSVDPFDDCGRGALDETDNAGILSRPGSRSIESLEERGIEAACALWAQTDSETEDVSMNAPLNPGKTFKIPVMTDPASLIHRRKGAKTHLFVFTYMMF